MHNSSYKDMSIICFVSTSRPFLSNRALNEHLRGHSCVHSLPASHMARLTRKQGASCHSKVAATVAATPLLPGLQPLPTESTQAQVTDQCRQAVHINSLTGRICTLTANVDAQVDALQSLIAVSSGIPTNEQRLLVGTTELSPSSKVRTALDEGDEILLIRTEPGEARMVEARKACRNAGIDALKKARMLIMKEGAPRRAALR
eukprot:TRINITY_DN14378_c0_g1_i9.p1 TRINITY_DN14378_c0_g1~~TRINITY_DN14378_c0_g1_i9.p1  ORF type:complete len:203 (-),score=29.63 TRINITY_DN14378_c0_g1_i9:79-687(-)